MEEPSHSVLEESLEILAHIHRSQLYAYQRLIVWGDQVATYVVREDLKKRQDMLVFDLREFSLSTPPMKIAETFWWAYFQLQRLNVPPGRTSSDRNLLRQIEERWCTLSTGHVH